MVDSTRRKTMTTTLQPGTIRTRVNDVRSVLRASVRDRLITADPSDGVVFPRLRRAEHAMQFPSLEAVGAIFGDCPPEFAAFVALCAFAGLRLGEAAAGMPPHQNTIGTRWRCTVAAAGLVPIRLHDLRHFYASGLIAEGCDVVTAPGARARESDTTLAMYSHLWLSAEDRTRTAASALMWASPNAPADVCGLAVRRRADSRVIPRKLRPHQTLKRNSTTSPSCIT